MKIEIIERSNLHYDVYVHGSRMYKIRGTLGGLCVICGNGDDNQYPQTLVGFKTVKSCLKKIFTLILKKI